MTRSIEPGERLSVEGVLLLGPDPRGYMPKLTIAGNDFAELAFEAFGNAARRGLLARVTIELLPRMDDE